MRLNLRSIRPPDPETPNSNDPASVPPATVGPPAYAPGDPDGVQIDATVPATTGWPPHTIIPSPWSGWPAEWWPPAWGSGGSAQLTDTAWACIDKNASALASMPPFLVGAAPSLDADWLRNPQPDAYSSWEEFCKQLFWDYQSVGEAYVYATAFYATGWPARFHVIPPYLVEAELAPDGTRRYRIGGVEPGPNELLHLRYQSSVNDPHGHGPLEAGRSRVVAAQMLAQYVTGLTVNGGIPPSILTNPQAMSDEQAAQLKAQWIMARQSNLGEPAVLSGGLTWQPTTFNPRDMALLEISEFNESRIAVLLGVPPFLVGLPAGGDSLTYSNITSLFDYHWRDGLRPMASQVMAGLSNWLLPRQTTVELNSDRYVQAPAYERAQTYQILNGIVDADGTPVLSVEQIQQAERIQTTPQPQGVLQ